VHIRAYTYSKRSCSAVKVSLWFYGVGKMLGRTKTKDGKLYERVTTKRRRWFEKSEYVEAGEASSMCRGQLNFGIVIDLSDLEIFFGP
jgi:hypothetical protein